MEEDKAWTQSKTILSVDDELVNRILVEESLKENFKIISVESGTAALETLKKEKVDIVLLDVMMPDISGHEVCKSIRESDNLKQIPVIFVTANGYPEDVKKGLEIGGNDYIVKPFHPTELKARIVSQLKVAEANALRAGIERLSTTKAMVASLNHEIRNPLSIVSGSMRAFKKETEEKKQKAVKNIEVAVDRIVSILDKITDLEKVETKKYLDGSATELIVL